MCAAYRAIGCDLMRGSSSRISGTSSIRSRIAALMTGISKYSVRRLTRHRGGICRHAFQNICKISRLRLS